MATIIRTIEDNELHKLSLKTDSGEDYLTDVMANSAVPLSGEDGADFDLTLEEYEWWRTWAVNEQLINETIRELGMEHAVPNFYDKYPDWDDAQRAYAECLGIETNEP